MTDLMTNRRDVLLATLLTVASASFGVLRAQAAAVDPAMTIVKAGIAEPAGAAQSQFVRPTDSPARQSGISLKPHLAEPLRVVRGNSFDGRRVTRAA